MPENRSVVSWGGGLHMSRGIKKPLRITDTFTLKCDVHFAIVNICQTNWIAYYKGAWFIVHKLYLKIDI